jgi:hypothetical protein
MTFFALFLIIFALAISGRQKKMTEAKLTPKQAQIYSTT